MAEIAIRLKRKSVHKWTRRALWAGNLGFGLAATLRPDSFAALMGETEESVRALAARDLRSGLELLSAPKPLWPLIRGLRSDAVEAFGWLRRKPRMAVFPVLWCLLAVAALATRE
jgi:hypothetical protein